MFEYMKRFIGIEWYLMNYQGMGFHATPNINKYGKNCKEETETIENGKIWSKGRFMNRKKMQKIGRNLSEKQTNLFWHLSRVILGAIHRYKVQSRINSQKNI